MDLICVVFLSFIIGIIAGFIASYLGIGAGIFMVPVIIFFLHENIYVAKAASLFAIIFIAPVSTYFHKAKGYVDIKIGIIIGIFGAFVSIIGTIVSVIIPSFYVELIFGITIISIGLWLLFSSEARAKIFRFKKFFAILIGIAGGFFAGFLGLGGGLIFVPGLVLIGYSIHSAVGTSLSSICITAIAGAATHGIYNFLKIEIAIPIAFGGTLGAFIGVKKATETKPKLLRKIFAYVIIFFGALMIFSLL
ncbi:MAG: sulfite exporter TauE/SafE family protein [Candidatus Thermoplasmatota archaeon]